MIDFHGVPIHIYMLVSHIHCMYIVALFWEAALSQLICIVSRRLHALAPKDQQDVLLTYRNNGVAKPGTTINSSLSGRNWLL